MTFSEKSALRSLNNFNFRIWSGGALVSNVGTWMQRTAQDWLVLTTLTHDNATAVGVVMGLQFGPQLLLLPYAGFAADHFDRRKLLIATQAALGGLALGLGILTISGLVMLWHVYVFAFLLGSVTAFDAPARQTFVAELVGEEYLSNAVGLNSTSFNAARLIGPAVAGALIASIGTGWVFIVNGASFGAVLISLAFLRIAELKAIDKSVQPSGSLAEGFRYVRNRPDLMAILIMMFLIGTFGINFPIYISAMSVATFHVGARQFGFLTSLMAVGSLSGALLAAKRQHAHFGLLLIGALAFGAGLLLAALMPSYWLFGAALVLGGVAAQTFTTAANSTIQLTTDGLMRGRVMAIFLAIAVGGTPLGAPIAGWVADRFGPRWALGLGASAGLGAALVAMRHLWIHRHLRFSFEGRRFAMRVDDPERTDPPVG